MVNNSTNINKADTHHSFAFTEFKNKLTYYVWNHYPGLGKAKQCGGGKIIHGIPTNICHWNLLLNATCLAKKQQISFVYTLGPTLGSSPPSTTLGVCMLTTTTHMRLNCTEKINKLHSIFSTYNRWMKANTCISKL